MWLFLAGFVSGALLGCVLMGLMAANTVDDLLSRLNEKEKIDKGGEDD